jgi:hypothetical protein
MKRIFFIGFAILFVFSAQAQTKTLSKKSKSTPMSAAAKSKAAIQKQEDERQAKIEADRLELLRSDSIRRDNDRIADSSFAAQQTMWKDSMTTVQDSVYADRYKNISAKQEEWAQLDRNRDAINKAAKLSDNQGRQVKNINELYTAKAKAVKDNIDLSEEQKNTQLASLNTERMDKLKAVLGKSKAKRLEKERKAYVKKNGTDPEQSWIDTSETVSASK